MIEDSLKDFVQFKKEVQKAWSNIEYFHEKIENNKLEDKQIDSVILSS